MYSSEHPGDATEMEALVQELDVLAHLVLAYAEPSTRGNIPEQDG
jgi:hypothetical protein